MAEQLSETIAESLLGIPGVTTQQVYSFSRDSINEISVLFPGCTVQTDLTISLLLDRMVQSGTDSLILCHEEFMGIVSSIVECIAAKDRTGPAAKIPFILDAIGKSGEYSTDIGNLIGEFMGPDSQRSRNLSPTELIIASNGKQIKPYRQGDNAEDYIRALNKVGKYEELKEFLFGGTIPIEQYRDVVNFIIFSGLITKLGSVFTRHFMDLFKPSQSIILGLGGAVHQANAELLRYIANRYSHDLIMDTIEETGINFPEFGNYLYAKYEEYEEYVEDPNVFLQTWVDIFEDNPPYQIILVLLNGLYNRTEYFNIEEFITNISRNVSNHPFVEGFGDLFTEVQALEWLRFPLRVMQPLLDHFKNRNLPIIISITEEDIDEDGLTTFPHDDIIDKYILYPDGYYDYFVNNGFNIECRLSE